MSRLAPVAAVGRAELRKSVLVTLLLVVLLGAAAGATIAAIAGARRTDSAYPRLVESTQSADVQVTAAVGQIDLDQVEHLRQVTESGRLLAFEIVPGREGPLDFATTRGSFASADGNLYYEIDQPHILEGRLPRRDRADEILVNKAFAEEFDLEIGDRYEGVLVDYGTLFEIAESGRTPEPSELDDLQTPLDFDVVGIFRGQGDLIPTEDEISESTMILSPRFAGRYGDQALADALVVNLRRGEAGVEQFKAEVRDLFPDAVIEFPSKTGQLETVGRAVTPYSRALYLFAAVVGITAFLVLGQILARQVALDATDVPVLRAMGLSPVQCVAVALTRSAVIAVAGGLLAVVVAAVASALFPFGPARLAEPDLGLRLDLPVLALGLVVTVVLVLARAALAAVRIVRRHRTAQGALLADADARPSAVARRLARAGAPPAPTTGVRFALERTGAFAGPLTTLIGLVAAVVAATASLGFGASLDRVISTPHLYGWNWDVLLAGYDGTTDAIAGEVGRDDDLVRKTDGIRTTIRIGGEDLDTFAFERGDGKVTATVVDGRLPRRVGEIALGARTQRDLDVGHGDTVTSVGSTDRRRRYEVVGTVVVPVLTLGETLGLSDGAVLTLDGLEDLEPALAPSFIAADRAPGITAAVIRDRYEQNAAVDVPVPPSELLSYRRLDNLPWILALVLAGLGGGVLSHGVVTSLRRRRKEVGVLKAIGFVRPQVTTAVVCEAVTLAALALVIGLPLGLVTARWGWTLFADELGVVAEPVAPFPWGVMAVALGALLLALAIAGLPGRSAARTDPAFALRSE